MIETSYKTLGELRDAFAGDGILNGLALRVDEDVCYLYEGELCLFRMPTDEVLGQALDILGIWWEPA